MEDIKLISPTGNSLRIMDHFGSGLYSPPREALDRQKFSLTNFNCFHLVMVTLKL